MFTRVEEKQFFSGDNTGSVFITQHLAECSKSIQEWDSFFGKKEMIKLDSLFQFINGVMTVSTLLNLAAR